MTYRDELEALRSHEASLEQELAHTRTLIAEQAARRSLLDSVRIASPCKATWDDMAGDERVRFCGQCAKNVYNLSAMPAKDAEELLRANESGMCVRLYRRADGTVITADCPVGVRKKRVRRLAVLAVGGGAFAAAAAMASAHAVTMGEPVRVAHVERSVEPTMGAPVVLEPLPKGEDVHAIMGTAPMPPKPPVAPPGRKR